VVDLEKVKLENITKSFKDGKREVIAVNKVSLNVKEGEFPTLLGPSGCGKTTTLRMIGGFEVPTSGKIYIGGKDMTNVPPNKRNTAMVFQSYALFPHMTVFDNVAYGLKLKKLPGEEIKKRVKRVLEMVNLTGLEKRYPGRLSGGQQQRVALARALVVEPEVLLLDEPLSNLDAKLREQMRTELKKIQRETGITFIYVTHDQAEAMVMSDRVVVMKDGKIIQVGSPEEIYRFPANKFVANFIGRANLIEAEILKISERVLIKTNFGHVIEVDVKNPEEWKAGDTVSLIVRPESVVVDEKGEITGKVIEKIYMGSMEVLRVDISGVEITAEIQNPLSLKIPDPGKEVRLKFMREGMAIVKE
jgi:iron(III) transport system ATP-binding protein